jgi:hypothetical protein
MEATLRNLHLIVGIPPSLSLGTDVYGTDVSVEASEKESPGNQRNQEEP